MADNTEIGATETESENAEWSLRIQDRAHWQACSNKPSSSMETEKFLE